MAIVSYRLYCTDCNADEVIRKNYVEKSLWKVESVPNHVGTCPSCNPAINNSDIEEGMTIDDEEVPFEELDAIGESGAENLREAGFVTRADVKNASDEELGAVSWVGVKGVSSIRSWV